MVFLMLPKGPYGIFIILLHTLWKIFVITVLTSHGIKNGIENSSVHFTDKHCQKFRQNNASILILEWIKVFSRKKHGYVCTAQCGKLKNLLSQKKKFRQIRRFLKNSKNDTFTKFLPKFLSFPHLQWLTLVMQIFVKPICFSKLKFQN